jgi:hypothetical protein
VLWAIILQIFLISVHPKISILGFMLSAFSFQRKSCNSISWLTAQSMSNLFVDRRFGAILRSIHYLKNIFYQGASRPGFFASLRMTKEKLRMTKEKLRMTKKTQNDKRETQNDNVKAHGPRLKVTIDITCFFLVLRSTGSRP